MTYAHQSCARRAGLEKDQKPTFLTDSPFECGSACPERGTQLTAFLSKEGQFPWRMFFRNPWQVSATSFPIHHEVRELLENALDQTLLIANSQGEVLFATRKTRAILAAFFAEMSGDLIPNEIRT